MSIHRADGNRTSPPPEQVREAQERSATRSAGRSDRQGDRVEISDRAREAERLRESAKELPSVREKEVREASTDQSRVDSSLLARLLNDADVL